MRGLANQLVLLAGLLLLRGCQQPGEPKPVDIEPGDMCAQCKMAIDEKRYAAEFIDTDGEVVKFDDIGCLRRYVERRANRASIAAFFVTDYPSRRWMRAEAAYYVQSAGLATPMRSGLRVYQDEAQARAAGAKFHGRLLRFADLWNE